MNDFQSEFSTVSSSNRSNNFFTIIQNEMIYLVFLYFSLVTLGMTFGFNEEISLTEWRTRYKTEFQEALQQMHDQCATLRHRCSELNDKLSNSNGIVSLHRKSCQTTPLLNGEVRPWKSQQWNTILRNRERSVLILSNRFLSKNEKENILSKNTVFNCSRRKLHELYCSVFWWDVYMFFYWISKNHN